MTMAPSALEVLAQKQISGTYELGYDDWEIQEYKNEIGEKIKESEKDYRQYLVQKYFKNFFDNLDKALEK